MQGQRLKQKLKNGDRVYGTHLVNFGNPLSAGWISDIELDFVFICTEHIPIDRTETAAMCKLYGDAGVSPIVRIPYPSGQWANMAVEGGAEGIVAPYVETVEEVKELVGSVKYRPIKGKLLRDMLDGVQAPTEKLQHYMEHFNKDLYLIIGVESMHAIEHLESLITIDGVDGVFLGPHDITCSMGIPEEYDHPKFVRTIVDVIERCRKANRGVGIHTDVTLDACRPFFDAGMNFVLNSADTIKLRDTLNDDFRTLRARFGDAYTRNELPETGRNIVY